MNDIMANTLDNIHDKINFNKCYSSGYIFSCLVNKFAKIQHYGYDFKPVNASLLDDKEKYAESLLMYAILGGIVMVGLTFLLFFFCCCNCIFRSSASKRSNKPSSRTMLITCNAIIGLMAIICALTFAIGYLGERRLENGGDNMCDTVHFAHDMLSDIVNQTNVIADSIVLKTPLQNLYQTILKIEKSIENIRTVGQNIPGFQEFEKNLPATENYHKQFEIIEKSFDDSIETVKDKLQTNLLKDIVPTLKNIEDDCPTYVKYIRIALLATLSVFIVISVFFILGFFHKCLRITSGTFGYIFFIISMLFACLFFIVLVAGSDGCHNAKEIILKEVNQKVLGYYLECNPSMVMITEETKKIPEGIFPFIPGMPPFHDLKKDIADNNIEQLFKDAKEMINYASTSMKTFEQLISQSYDKLCTDGNNEIIDNVPEIKENVQDICVNLNKIQKDLTISNSGTLGSKVQSILKHFDNILQIVNCDNITPKINDVLENICTNVYEGFFLLFINFGVATIIFYLLLLLNVWLLYSE